MNRLFYSPEARNDLDAIWSYIQSDLQNPAAARSTVFKILDDIEKLRDFGELGAKLSAITHIESDYRYLICGKYLAFYRIACGAVYIDRILYGRRDYMSILFGELIED